jgi:acetyl-CoA C-acetyltransferase
VAAGIYDIVIACGVEKLLDTGGSGLSIDQMYPHTTLVGQSAPGIFAPGAMRAFKEYGWTKEDLGRVAVKNHHNGVKHPKAHFRREITLDVAVNAPMICSPLGLYDCCAVSDGAAALILTTPEIAKDRVGTGNYATVKGIGMSVHTRYPFNDPDYTGISIPSTKEAVASAYEQAGIRNPRKELDFGIVHDCFTIAELFHYQDLGLCAEGESADLIREGVTAIDGDFPINPDGGLKCFGHPIGATGCRMVAEVTRQVLGKAEGHQVKDAKAGFAHNLGGPLSVAMITIVGTPDWEAGG